MKIMRTSKQHIIAILLLAAGLLGWTTESRARQPQSNLPANAYQLAPADDKAIQAILKDQETAWNKHDMNAFTTAFRDDAEGINVAGMYWQGKAELLKHLTDFHATSLRTARSTCKRCRFTRLASDKPWLSTSGRLMLSQDRADSNFPHAATEAR